jgi:hypothetical protein
MKETVHNLIERFQLAQASWSKVPDEARRQEQVWFAGLAVSPVDFSQQLSSLQLSLEREGAPVKGQRALR